MARVVYVDVETGGGNHETCEILQIAACCGNETFSRYIVPQNSIHPACTNCHGMYISTAGYLCRNNAVLPTTTLQDAFYGLICFLQRWAYPQVYIVGYNGVSMDFPLLFRDARRLGYDQQFRSLVAGATDAIQVLKERLNYGNKLPSLETIAQDLGINTYGCHDAARDVQILEQVCNRAGVQPGDVARLTKYY